MPKIYPTQEPIPTPVHIFKKPKVLLLLAVLLTYSLLSLLIGPTDYLQASDLSSENILNAVNRERSLRNLVLLNTNDKLSFAAQAKSNDMQARHYFAHVDPDGNYIWDRIVAAGYTPYAQLGENLAIEFYDTDSLVNAWMNSPTHRANILQEGFKDQGMGLNLGDTALNQYHSAVVNTFGALAVSAKLPKTISPPASKPAPSPKPTPVAHPPPPTPAAQPQPQPTPVPAPIAPPPPTPPLAALDIRGENLAQNTPAEDFALPPSHEPAAEPATTSSQPILPNNNNLSASALIDAANTAQLTGFQINRYLILICGVLLMLLLLSDVKVTMEKKLAGLDKKINNLVLLIISLAIVAFMYWL